MRAIRLHAVRHLTLDEIPEPSIKSPDEVRLRVEIAGICGSDLHNYRTGMWMTRTPSTPGHEFVGTVAEIGDAVADLVPGDRVVADSRVPCGHCPACRAGQAFLCRRMGFVGEVNDGGFAPFVVLPERQLIRLPDQTVSPDVAAMSEPLAVALHAVNRLSPPAGSTVGVVGAGPIGALATVVLRHRGHEVLLAERKERRLAQVTEVTGAEPWELDADRNISDVGAAIDTTGAEAALNLVLRSIEPGGRLAIVGLYHGPAPVELNLIVERGLDVRGCAAFDTELVDAVALLPELAPSLRRFGSEPIGLSHVPEMYEQLIADPRVVKALIDPTV